MATAHCIILRDVTRFFIKIKSTDIDFTSRFDLCALTFCVLYFLSHITFLHCFFEKAQWGICKEVLDEQTRRAGEGKMED